ncbi:hypothetical protein BKA67DRAFT_250165 [Truncatella angustata]|uniref:Uncharacterized protein n=1 Tax=Truncatella angustata TaxID=152316 RepID=A0A9P8UP20_9PEZI|nr:uncharacterized protein BKA67DRAFT_250165 [Truncatella angustata]KAH6655816.1 hypothetical protein BKA67DRAFT_250165 [Truncatella angustata]KAH8199400.1 hypothetical protein TruAng_006444 [Truncatella angustata]
MRSCSLFVSALFLGASLFTFVFGAPVSPINSPVLVQLVPQTISLENLALRRNGDILTTSTASSSLFLVSLNSNWTYPIVVHDFPTINILLGIAELDEDVFYVTGAVSASSPNPLNEIWEVDMRPLRISANGTILQPAAVTLVSSDTSGGLYNGMTRLATNDTSNILLADTFLGTVTRVNVATGESAVVIQDPLLTVQNETNLAIAVNGIHTRYNKLYFTNLNQGVFGSVPISLTTGEQTGTAEIIASGLFVVDDFVLKTDGTKAWVAMNGPYDLVEVDITTKTSRVAVNSSLLGAESAVAFGRTCRDSNYLYITTSQPAGNSTIGSIVKVALA